MEVDQFGPSGLMMAPSVKMGYQVGLSSDNQMVQLTKENNTEMMRLIQQYLHGQGYTSIAD